MIEYIRQREKERAKECNIKFSFLKRKKKDLDGWGARKLGGAVEISKPHQSTCPLACHWDF